MLSNPVKEFIRHFREAIFSIVMLIIFALIIYFTKDIKLLVVNTTVDARFWPKVCGIVGIILSLVLFVQSIIEGTTLAKKKKAGLLQPEPAAALLSGERVRPLVTLLLMTLYIAGLEKFGFLLMTFLYLFFQFLLLSDKENRSIPILLLIDVSFTIAVYLLFRYVFQMILPTGTFWG